ncbi:hypothetical protein Asppvi_002796 [Aspergillus pseudoviridinutans]|uniref:DNA replication regulator Sld3 C-terminal domain-containing protein n=1 Tax=Aspergillus pseudoviridinutans TaxID=1517512 RepID=A0A9P3EQJ0_9EURO|nr:uncharacterized protein Asppvi_002796 [Aspergillus pseudoviridinutans]GIJ83964.1 hypothetical protein Asppvi_002796 [Aspergillus pseudoviridinutans]
MASRRSSGVLETLSSFSLNRLHDPSTTHPPLKKRKTYHAATGELSRQTISIRAHAAALSDEPYVLEPIAVVPRSRLPFSWLDSPAALSQIQSGSLFVANIPLLEDGLQSRTEPCVLAVRLIPDGELYAVERVKRGIYALSKLARSVEEGDIFVAVKGWNPSTRSGEGIQSDLSLGAESGEEWWQQAKIDDAASVTPPSAKRAKFDVSLVFNKAAVDASVSVTLKEISPVDSLEQRPSMAPPALPMERSSSSDMQMPFVLHDSRDADGAVFGDVAAHGATQPADPAQCPQELLDAMREHYLQALYISKTSVAYFAKGPLARCRAAFQASGSDSTNTPRHLADFYRESILAAKKMDLKYRETLPSTIRDVLLSTSDDDARKKRKSRKRKLGKNGLYPEEEGFIRKWWRDRALADNGVPAESSHDAELKKHIADLRLRETQLQILLILETLALEMSGPGETSKTDGSPEKLSDDTRTKSKKKPQDLDVLLELHLDRLCIWHAVSTDDTALAESAKSFDSQTGKKIESDAVRDFCTEVIVPFYASRLPDRCKLITRKLGVSGAISPLAKQSGSTKKTSRTEPGKPTERQSSQRNPRRSLQRVLTDQQTTSQGRPPSLGRSNTVPSQSEAKRESMEPLLPVLSVSARGGIQKPKRAENREVDLNAVARQHEAKLKKVQMLMEQKKELDAAINALRKPNRELVAKDIAEDAVKRASGGSSRKPKNPVRNPFGQGVQVMATPKGNRKKDAVTGLPPPFKNIVRSSASKNGSSPFASEPQVVPASTLRPSFISNTPASESRTASGFGSGDTGAIQETPSRRPAQSLGLMDTAADDASPGVAKNLFRVPRRPIPKSADVAPSTPIAPRSADQVIGIKSSTVMETPPRPPPVIHESMPAASPAAVLTTPVKGSARLAVPVVSAVPVTPEKSIYEQLGWDDDLA